MTIRNAAATVAVAISSVLMVSVAPAAAVVGEIEVVDLPPDENRTDMALAPDGALWYTNTIEGRVRRVDPVSGEVQSFAMPRPRFLDIAEDGVVYVASNSSTYGGVYRIAVDGTVEQIPGIPPSQNYLLLGPDGHLWLRGNFDQGSRYATDGTHDEEMPNVGIMPIVGPDGYVWSLAGGFARTNPDDLSTEYYPLQQELLGVETKDFELGPDGNLWMSSTVAELIATIDPGTGEQAIVSEGDLVAPTALSGAGDGNLWVSQASDRLARVVPATGQITQFTMPLGVRSATQLIEDPNGDLWGLNNLVGLVHTTVGADDCDLDPEPVAFPDTDPDGFYAGSLPWAACHNLMNAYDNGDWRPHATLRRGPLMEILWRFADLNGPNDPSGFPDADEDYVFHGGVDWATAEAITTGYGDGTFRPTNVVNRFQLITFLWRLAGEPTGYPATAFPDVAEDVFWHDALDWAVAEGLTNPWPDGTWRPSSALNRGQLVTILDRLASTETAWSAWDGWDLTMWRYGLEP